MANSILWWLWRRAPGLLGLTVAGVRGGGYGGGRGTDRTGVVGWFESSGWVGWLHAQGWVGSFQFHPSAGIYVPDASPPRPTDPRNHGDEVYRAKLFNCTTTRLTDIRTESPSISWCPASRLAARSHATTSASQHLELYHHKDHSPPASLSSYRLPALLRVTSSFGCGEHPDSMACPTWSPFPSKPRRAGKGKS